MIIIGQLGPAQATVWCGWYTMLSPIRLTELLINNYFSALQRVAIADLTQPKATLVTPTY